MLSCDIAKMFLKMLPAFFLSVFLFLFCLFPLSAISWAASYYVAMGGSDAYPGTLEQPFATINEAANRAMPGDTVYLRSGTYNQIVYVWRSGTAATPITYSGYPGETTVIDGQDTLPTADWGALFNVEGSYVVVRDLTVQNSNWMGLVLRGQHDQAINVKSYKNKEHGILVNGDYGLVENSEVWWNCKSNEYGKMLRGNWASGLSAGRHPYFATIRKCKVWNNWGEGLSTFEAQNTTMEDNVVYDNWRPNVYLSDAKYTIFQRNLVYSTPGNPCNSGVQIGIAMGDEAYNPPSSDIKVINNFVSGNMRKFCWWQGVLGGGLINTLIGYNTFVNSVNETNFKIENGTHSNTSIENNIILQEDSLPIAIIESSGGLSFSYNLWSKTFPPNASGTGNVIGNPQLRKTGPTGPGELTPEWFKILDSSPARERAKVINEATEDYFGTARGRYPDMGAYELPSQPAPPTGLRVIP